MRNLFLFIWKYQFTLIFLGLEVIGFYLLVSNNQYQQTQLHEAGVALSGEVYSWQYAYTQYLGLSDENEALREENARLREAIKHVTPALKDAPGRFDVIPATAINSTYHLERNFILINAGSEDGVEPASAVLGPRGVVGIVHSVSSHYASILPLIHSESKVSGRLARTRYFGQCRWTGFDEQYILLENIPNHVDVKRGDTIVTRGGGIFPPGQIIGFADKRERDESSGFQRITVQLATDFKKISSLYVVQNKHREELDSLMIETEEWTD